MKCVTRHCVMEWSFNSARHSKDPFNQVEFLVVFIAPDGSEKMPGFWAGGSLPG